ncbi:MAG: hypothetical protein FJX65_01105 [Alphaproteobacteria bacterium]|nr:hypothetical protein [Alphaproteobacteria bacterium]
MSRLAALFVLSLLALVPGLGHGQALVTDLSEHVVTVNSSFTGTELLLFGMTDGPGDIVVVVQGPREDVVVRRKENVGGLIWINRRAVGFERVPGYYVVASSRQLTSITTLAARAQHRMGADYLDFSLAASTRRIAGAELTAFRQAVVRNKRAAELYYEAEESVQFVGERLFRTKLTIPAHAPDGNYTVNTYLLRNQQVVAQQSTPLSIVKSGFEQTVFSLAHEQPAIYGLAAVLISVFAGWAAAAIFRKS